MLLISLDRLRITKSFSSDFFLDVDGNSVIAGQNHVCVLEYKHGIDIGGKVSCWDGEEDESVRPPDEVRVSLLSPHILSFSSGDIHSSGGRIRL